MANQQAISVQKLCKQFGNFHAVKDVNFSVQTGEIFSLLGPNGAGKSTTISMLCGLLDPSSGEATVMGHPITRDPMQVKESIGVAPQEIALYEDLTARENLAFWGRMYDLRNQTLKDRINEVLSIIGLTDRQHDRVDTFSGGMKRRVNIGIALLHKPAVLILDEPTVGIDPQSRRHILDSVKALNDKGMTVLYTTHYMEEAQELSNHIAIMDRGELIACGTHDELVNIVGEMTHIDLTVNTNGQSVLEPWEAAPGVHSLTTDNGTITLLVDDSNAVLPHLFEIAAERDAHITSVDIQEPNLEAVFLHLTGRALRD